MKKLQKKAFSEREATFALTNCVCVCGCSCPKESCNCPIAPTHQYGLNAQVENDTEIRRLTRDGAEIPVSGASNRY